MTQGLGKIYEEFNSRHDFDDSDLKVLASKYPNIKFNNIPTAWIIVLDDLLTEIDYRLISKVEQIYGLIAISFFNPISDKNIDTKIMYAQDKINILDRDIWSEYQKDIWQDNNKLN